MAQQCAFGPLRCRNPHPFVSARTIWFPGQATTRHAHYSTHCAHRVTWAIALRTLHTARHRRLGQMRPVKAAS